VKLSPGTFLQASREAETVVTGLVRDGVGAAKRVTDLFAGLGTFTFALARTPAVDAFEADGAALTALAEVARSTPKLKSIRTFDRDLFRFPLRSKELAAYNAVVFDPPRAGAAQTSLPRPRSRSSSPSLAIPERSRAISAPS